MTRPISINQWFAESGALLKLAGPLIVAQLASIMIGATDVLMMGWLGPEYLAAGSLSTSLLHPLFLGGVGAVSATAPLIAQAIGAREGRSVRRTVRQGMWVAFVLTAVIAPILLSAGPIFRALGQDPAVTLMAQSYLNIAWAMVLPGLLMNVLRSLLQAKGSTTFIVLVTFAMIFVNGIGNYALMFGNFGLPRLELQGAALSTIAVHVAGFLLMLIYVLKHKRYRRYHILVRFWKPDWKRFFDIWRIGVPIGLTLMSEVAMFGVAVIMMGWLGVNEVAGHAVAMQCAATAFMVPLGLSQATVVRVGLAVGSRNKTGITLAGWAAFWITMVMMIITAGFFIAMPEVFSSLFFADTSDPDARTALMLAASYLTVAGFFQLADGAQVSMAASLRGMSDTRVPMIAALVGYWLVGMSIAYVCGFILGWGGVGIWVGLASGLGFVAIILTIRFAMRERLGLFERSGYAEAPVL